MSLWEEIRLRIRAELNRQGISHAKYGQLTGISVTQISNYLRGSNVPSIDKLSALAKGLGWAPIDLITDSPRPFPKPRDPTPEEMAMAVFDALGLKGDRAELIRLLLQNDDINFDVYQGAIKKSLSGAVSNPANNKPKPTG